MCRGTVPVPLSPGESFYWRFYTKELSSEDGPTDAMIKPPDQSVNRSGLGGKPWFALMPEPGVIDSEAIAKKLNMGILTFQATAVPTPFQSDTSTTRFDFVLEHDPLDHNYHHCEIRVYSSGRRFAEATATKSEKTEWKAAKKYYRTCVRESWERRELTICWEESPGNDAPKSHALVPWCVTNLMVPLR